MRVALRWALAIFAALVIGWGLLHVLISPVNPSQQPPSGHFAGSCWLCHFTSQSVKMQAE